MSEINVAARDRVLRYIAKVKEAARLVLDRSPDDAMARKAVRHAERVKEAGENGDIDAAVGSAVLVGLLGIALGVPPEHHA